MERHLRDAAQEQDDNRDRDEGNPARNARPNRARISCDEGVVTDFSLLYSDLEIRDNAGITTRDQVHPDRRPGRDPDDRLAPCVPERRAEIGGPCALEVEAWICGDFSPGWCWLC